MTAQEAKHTLEQKEKQLEKLNSMISNMEADIANGHPATSLYYRFLDLRTKLEAEGGAA